MGTKEMTEEILLSKVIAGGLLIKPGDTFLSKVTGKLVMCCECDADTDHSRISCTKCVYNSKENFSGCIGYIHTLRLIEAGHCVSYHRKDNKDVYFKEVESLYEISQETKELLESLYYTSSAISANERFEYMRLLLDTEYYSYSKTNGTKVCYHRNPS